MYVYLVFWLIKFFISDLDWRNSKETMFYTVGRLSLALVRVYKHAQGFHELTPQYVVGLVHSAPCW